MTVTSANGSRPTSASSGLLRRLTIASRPVSWVNTAYPFAAAWLVSSGMPAGSDLLLLILGAVYFLVPYNLAMYGINDVFDYASDVANPRKGGAEGALLPPETHRSVLLAVAITNLPFLIAMMVLARELAIVTVMIAVFFVIAYSAPPFRWKEVPLLDSITSAMHFVMPAVVGLAAAGAPFSGVAIGVLLAFTAWAMASHAFGAVQDILPDRQGGLASIATVIGARGTVWCATLLWLVSAGIMVLLGWPVALAAAVPLLYVANAAPHWRVSDASSGETNRAWRRFLWLNYLSGFLVTMLLIAVAMGWG